MEGSVPPTIERAKSCIPATLSDNADFNRNIITCETLPEAKESNSCQIPACPVAPKWLEWTLWTPCSSTCGPHATRKRSRSFITGRHGGDDKPSGNSEEVEYCSRDTVPNWGSCPVDARHGKWNPWPACSKTCFKEGSYTPTVERTKECIPEIPSDNPDFNRNIITCDTLHEFRESKPCQIPLCSVPAR